MEHTVSRAVRLFAHDLGDEAIERNNPGRALAAAEQLGAVDIPGRDIGAGTGAGIFMLHIDRPLRGRWKRGMFASPGLDAGLFVGA